MTEHHEAPPPDSNALVALSRLIEWAPEELRGEAERLGEEISAQLGAAPPSCRAIFEATKTLKAIRDELEQVEPRRLVDSIAHLSSTLTATRTRQEARGIQAAAMAFAGVAHDIDELVLHHNTDISDLGDVLQEKMERSFAESGIVRFAPRVGLAFDKARHKVLSAVPTDQEHEDRTICEVVRRGYERADQVLSPALVIINKLNA